MTEVQRGEIWWLDLPEPEGSEPGNARPVLVLQSDSFNRSRIATVIVAVITSNLLRAEAPGNVIVRSHESRLTADSVVNVSQILTTDRAFLRDRTGQLTSDTIQKIERGVAMVLALKLAN